LSLIQSNVRGGGGATGLPGTERALMTSVVRRWVLRVRFRSWLRLAQPTMIRTRPDRAPATSGDGRGLRELGLDPGDETARQAVRAMVESR
jgi:hypothetical protein